MNNGSYWIGQDGNVYVAGSQGTNSAGRADANTDSYWGSRGFNKINDPNPGGLFTSPQGPSLSDLVSGNVAIPWDSPAGTGVAPDSSGTPPGYSSTISASPGAVGTGATPKVFNQAGATNTQLTIDQIPGLLAAALGSEDQNYANTTGGFNAQEAGQRKTYGTSTDTNQQNYDSNFMDSIRAGIHGLGGLLSILRGTGAGGGTAEGLARDTVGGVTANDIRGGADTQKENQTALDSSLGTFLTDLQLKKKQAEDTHTNNTRAINRDSNTQLQDLFGKMAGFYGDVGNTGASNDWMAKAGALTPDIAANSKTQVSPYDNTPVVVHAPNLTAFSGPTQPSTLTAPSDGQVGSGIFTIGDRRRKDATAPVGV